MKYVLLALFVVINIGQVVHSSTNKNAPSPFNIVATNSPVKTGEAVFLFQLPKDFQVDKVSYFILGPKIYNLKLGLPKDVKLSSGSKGPELKIAVSNWKNGFYRLFVKVTDKKKKVYDFKSSLRDYVSFSIDKVKLPPPPAPDKNSSLLGVDSDTDGIRDDVQIWIEQKYSAKPLLKSAAKQLAIASQQSLIDKDNKIKSVDSSREFLRAHTCYLIMLQEMGSESERLNDEEVLGGLFSNNKERILAQEKINLNFNGQSFTSPDKEEACDN